MSIGSHSHTCPGCQHTWVHGNECAGDTDAHRCPTPTCNLVVWTRNMDWDPPLILDERTFIQELDALLFRIFGVN